MRAPWFIGAAFLVTACGPSDKCEVPPQPKLISAKNLSREERANALGVPPERVPQEAVTESPGALAAYDAYAARHNEAYKARNMKDEMSTVARAIMATCKESAESDTLATVLKYRNCAAGNK
jgi:hypothetical protein